MWSTGARTIAMSPSFALLTISTVSVSFSHICIFTFLYVVFWAYKVFLFSVNQALLVCKHLRCHSDSELSELSVTQREYFCSYIITLFWSFSMVQLDGRPFW